MKISLKIRNILSVLSSGLPEKEEALGLGLLACMAGESLFLLGPPGVAKSLLARRLKHAFRGARAFEYLMGRFSTPEEIFGPLSIAGLRDRDVFERRTEGYLPEADIAFLDEIWRASSPIQNALLTILNEKVFRNGGREIKVPLKGIVAASNRLPENEESAEAFWDRFLVRLEVGPLDQDGHFQSMILDSSDLYACPLEEDSRITVEEWNEVQRTAKDVSIPQALLDLITRLRNAIIASQDKKGAEAVPTPWDFYVSDRRWKKIVRLLKVCARLHDRMEVDLLDLFLVIPCLWNTPEQLTAAEELVTGEVRSLGYPVPADLDALTAIWAEKNRELRDLTKSKTSVQRLVPTLENGEYFTIEGYDPFLTARFWSEDFPLLEEDKDLECDVYFFENSALLRTEKLPLRSGGGDSRIKVAGEVFSLRSHTVWEESLVDKTPDPEALEAWRKGTSAFLRTLEKAQDSLMNERQQKELSADEHLFVPEIYVQPTLEKWDEASQLLAALCYRVRRAEEKGEADDLA